MKRLFLACLLSLLSAFRIYASEPDVAGLVPDRTEHDFGDVKLGTTSRVRFNIKAQSAAVVILSAATNCECTKAAYPKKPLRRGEEGEIEVSFEARETGYFRKTITVRYNADGRGRTLRLTVSGRTK